MATEKEREYARRYRIKNRERLLLKDKTYRNSVRKIRRREDRIKVINHYSKGLSECDCCGEKEIKFLVLDHIDGEGNAHRRKEKIASGRGTIEWIIKNNFPPMFQILCQNCNLAKAIYGECPHKINKK